MRLIDADAIKEKIGDIWNGRPLSVLGARILAMIDEIPTIDAVSVVRCGECRYCHSNYVDMTPPYAHDYCYKWSRYIKADDFCSYGERSDDGKDIQSTDER